MELCREIGALYIDTVVEPWPGFYFDKRSARRRARTTRCARRVLAARRAEPGGTTAVSCCGANPGMVSWFVKQALLNLAADTGLEGDEPTDARGLGAARRRRLGVKGIHIAERDTQRARDPEAAATCSSIPGRSRASCRRACSRPSSAGARMRNGCRRMAGKHQTGCGAAIYLLQPGANTRVRSWTPDRQARNTASWSPTTSRSRSPTISPCATAGQRRLPADLPLRLSSLQRRGACRCTRCSAAPAAAAGQIHILDENEIVDGIDELGVLLYGHEKNAYWYGSQLSIEETRRIAPYQNATGLQVTSAVLAGMVWALENPEAGIVEADEMDFRRCLEVQMPYLGPVIGAYTDWTPLDGPPGPVSRGHRHVRSLAVPQRAGAVTDRAPPGAHASRQIGCGPGGPRSNLRRQKLPRGAMLRVGDRHRERIGSVGCRCDAPRQKNAHHHRDLIFSA